MPPASSAQRRTRGVDLRNYPSPSAFQWFAPIFLPRLRFIPRACEEQPMLQAASWAGTQAGSSRVALCDTDRGAVYPRACREHSVSFQLAFSVSGSSLRGWGTAACARRHAHIGRGSSPVRAGSWAGVPGRLARDRFIPVHTGNSKDGCLRGRRSTVHPRARGTACPEVA